MREHVNGNGSYSGEHPDRKMNGSVNGNGQGNHHDCQPARRMMAHYLIGACSPEESEIVEDHCLECETCCAQLATLVHMMASSEYEREEDRRELNDLALLGEQAAARARDIVRRREG